MRLKAQPVAWRRRVGDWRILFDADLEARRVLVHDLLRRTSMTSWIGPLTILAVRSKI